MTKKISKNLLKVCLLSFAFIFISTNIFAKNNFDYVYTIKTTNFDFKPQKNNFLDSLAREYKSYAIYKNDRTDDFNGANFFAKKSLKAYAGEYVKPVNVYKMNMKLSTAAHVYRLYDDLMFLFDKNFTEKYPLLMADVQVKFDCFIDNEILNKNPKQAKVCYKKFAKTMAILNKKLEEICDGKCKLARQEKNIGKNLLRKKDLKSNLQVARKKSKLKHTKRNPQLNRYVEIYPLNEIDKLMEEKILIKNEAFVRPIGKKVPNNEFVIPIKDSKKTTEEKKIPSGFANTVAGTDLANKAAVSVKPVSEQDKAKDETQTDTKANVTDNIPSMTNDGKASLYDIQKKLQEIELKIDLLSKKNCNCNLDAVKKDLSNLTDKTNKIKETGDNNAVASLENEANNLEDQIDSIEPDKDETTEDEIESDVTEDSASVASENADKVTENGGSITVESEITEEIEVIEEDEKADDLIDATKDPEFQQITEKETVETEIFDKPSSALPYELYFDWDKDNVKPEYRTQLQDITDKALKSKETIVIQGHTDNTGNEKYNDNLSKRRATNVGKVVMSYGVPKEKIILQGVGSREPKVPTKKGQRNEKNRRVVIK